MVKYSMAKKKRRRRSKCKSCSNRRSVGRLVVGAVVLGAVLSNR